MDSKRRTELLEKIVAHTILMREIQNQYFALRKVEAVKFPGKESRKVLQESKRVEAELDLMLEELMKVAEPAPDDDPVTWGVPAWWDTRGWFGVTSGMPSFSKDSLIREVRMKEKGVGDG